MSLVLLLLVTFVAIELVLGIIIWHFRKSFPWLILPSDQQPTIDHEQVERHFQRGFDPELGWVRHPNTSGQDALPNGKTVTFNIDEHGARNNRGFEGTASLVAAFGDSFTFCRLVADTETWPHLLSKKLNTNVLNFGVGNYGLDQALLRFERELPNIESPVIVMGVVPETMSRIHSCWKHYFEYGNVLAFKPRFTERQCKLTLHPMMLHSVDDYLNYADRLEDIQELDPFYKTKFCPDILRFPYSWRIARNWQRTGRILVTLIWGAIARRQEEAIRRAFDWIIKDNAKITAKLYNDPEAKSLLGALVKRFVEQCRLAGRVPVLAVLPQPIDLEFALARKSEYRSFFDELSVGIDVVDLTDIFLDQSKTTDLFCEGKLGPHPSPRGNALIATRLEMAIRPILERLDAAPSELSKS